MKEKYKQELRRQIDNNMVRNQTLMDSDFKMGVNQAKMEIERDLKRSQQI